MVTPMSLKIQQTNETLEESGDVVRTPQHTFLLSLGHIPTNILHRFCCSGQHQELFGGEKKKAHVGVKTIKLGCGATEGPSPALSQGRVRVPAPLEKTLAVQSMRDKCPSSALLSPRAAEALQQLSCKPCSPGRVSGLRQQHWGWSGGQEGKELPLHLPSPLHGRLVAAAVPAALRGSQAASQTSQHCRGCLLFLFSGINFSTAKTFPH